MVLFIQLPTCVIVFTVERLHKTLTRLTFLGLKVKKRQLLGSLSVRYRTGSIKSGRGQRVEICQPKISARYPQHYVARIACRSVFSPSVFGFSVRYPAAAYRIAYRKSENTRKTNSKRKRRRRRKNKGRRKKILQKRKKETPLLFILLSL